MAKPAKRRDRRDATAAAQNRTRPGSSAEQGVPGDSASDRKLLLIFVVFFVLSPAVAVLVYRLKYAPVAEAPGSSAQGVGGGGGGGLVKTDVTYQEVLAENSRVSENASRRNFGNPVLAYITPWNSKGYEIAKQFNSKFTHLSPVWYELKSQGSSLTLDGRHNADVEWISELRKKGDAQVLPRVVLEVLPTELLRKKKQRAKAIQLIVTECKEMGYDGIVLESWSRWAAYGILDDPDLRSMALQFIQALGRALHSVSLERSGGQNLQLVYVIGPPRSKEIEMHDFGPADLQSLDGAVDGYSLMTYDFSGPNNPGPNAPLKWIHFIMRLLLGTGGDKGLGHKIFVGLNFYGNDFELSGGGGAITGADYLSLLEKHKPLLRWEKNSEEHFFVYTDQNNAQHAVFYPSLMSIFLRLEEARHWGAGISIWEIGQGLDYFYDLL